MKVSLKLLWVLALSTVLCGVVRGESRAWLPIGGDTFNGWTGLHVNDHVATLPAEGVATFEYPKGPKGWFTIGFRDENDSTRDWRPYCGVQLEVHLSAKPSQLDLDVLTPPPALRQEFIAKIHAAVALPAGNGWKQFTVPWSAFNLNPSQHAMLEFVQQLRLAGPGIEVRNIRLARAAGIALEADVRGRAVPAGGTAAYDVVVTNCTDQSQVVSLSAANVGWVTMNTKCDPPQVTLPAGASAPCRVTVEVPTDGVPPGGHETQTIVATSGTAEPATLALVTAREIGGPSILHTAAEWAAVRDNVARYDWAKSALADYVNQADQWQVPQAAVPPKNWSTAEKHVYTFENTPFLSLQPTAVAWQVTREKKYAEKVATFLRRLSDPKTGYPATFAGTNLGSPQEGGNFQCVAIAYDAIRDANVLSDADCRQIEHTFRLFMQTYETDLTVGNVGNWSTAANTACLMEALGMGDLSAADRYLHGPCGFDDYVSKGIMDDGWWWECSSSYNFWVASELTQSALACRPWGIDLLHAELPASYSTHTIINPWALDPPYGISFEKWGPNHRSTRSVKQLWDAVPAAADYRGITFGLNDGHGERVGGSRFELAYYALHDPAYATVIKLTNKRDLVYGMPDLADDPAKPYTKSGYAENIGYALLRSQTPDRPMREQIQAVLKIGTQGGFHGHFDRVSLDNLTRYGRDFWYPEAIWWGYPNYMYKFYVQTSINHNMVVVDQKQQEAVASTQPLFFSGKLMQVAVQETNARWSDPPYGGMRYQPGVTWAEQQRKNNQSLPPVTDRAYGELGPYTDRVRQRRMAVVTDDYVLIADYVKSSQPHTFDNLFQMSSFRSLDAPGKQHLRHDAQWTTDPHRGAQAVTDCDWFSASAPAVARFHIVFPEGKPDADYNEPGVLNVDVHTVWPPKQELMLGTPAENVGQSQWVTYDVAGDDGKSLAHGESGMWILGAANLDLPIGNAKRLTLTVSATGSNKKSLFWTNARFVTADGKAFPVTAAADATNAEMPATAGQDYYGGTIKIAGLDAIDPLPTQPKNDHRPAVLQLAVPAGAVRFSATLGADYPLGDPSHLRKLFASRVQGTEATFLTVMEPYEKSAVVKSATATGPDSVRVELTDGRVQVIHLRHFDGAANSIGIDLHETQPGHPARDEHAGPSND